MLKAYRKIPKNFYFTLIDADFFEWCRDNVNVSTAAIYIEYLHFLVS